MMGLRIPWWKLVVSHWLESVHPNLGQRCLVGLPAKRLQLLGRNPDEAVAPEAGVRADVDADVDALIADVELVG